MTQQPTHNQVREPASLALAPETAGKQSSANSGPLGLFGGRFDPVHRAHLKIAQAVADQLKLDEIRWIVTGAPVHKPAVASGKHRLAMVRIALQELSDPKMKVDDREIRSAEKTNNPSYTADTVIELLREEPGRQLIWILGEDQLQDFQTWSRWEWLARNIQLAVCARPEAAASDMAQRIQNLGGVIHWIEVEPDNISSTQIRQAIANGQQVRNSLPVGVPEYIQKNRLYL